MATRVEVAKKESRTGEAGRGFVKLLHGPKVGDEPPDYGADPGAAFRQAYDHWVKNGGYERGKPRHSIRQIKVWLGDDQVRSLETKLAGKTWLQYQDAHNLLRVMLCRWRYEKAGNRYEPYVPEPDLDDTIRSLLKDLFPPGQKALLLPERSRKTEGSGSPVGAREAAAAPVGEQTRPTGEVICELFTDSDALLTISRARAVLGSDPALAMTNFHNLMASLHQIAKATQRGQILLWIVELGLRNDKAAARGGIYNIYFLIAQFRTISLIQREGREELYEWLRQHAFVVVGSLTEVEIDRLYKVAGLELSTEAPDSPWFQGDRLFIESIPHRWLDVAGSNAFSKRQAELWAGPTITAHLRLDDWSLDHSPELDIRKNLRYMFHGEVAVSGQGSGIRCIPLPEPGSRWSDGYRLAVQAVFSRMGRPYEDRLGKTGPTEALRLLRNQKFAVLRLDEFLHMVDVLIDDVNVSETRGQR